jgi:copper transport protein
LGTLAAQDGSRTWEITGTVGRGLGYAGALLVGGIGLFLAVVASPIARDERAAAEARADRRRLSGLVVAGAAVAVVGLVADLASTAALASGRGWSALNDGVTRNQALGGGVGLRALGVVLGLALVAAGLGRWATPGPGRPVRSVARAVLVAGWVLCSATFALAGHVTASSPRALATAAVVVHVLAAAAWFGGLTALAALLAGRRRRALQAATARGGPEDGTAALGAAALVLRFSQLATVAIMAVAVGGAVLTWVEVRSWRALTTTTYGSLVIAKVAGLAVLVAVGAFNHYRLVPSLRREVTTTSATWARLRRTVRAEIAVLVGVLAVTAVLTGTTPGRSAVTPSLFSASVELGQGSLYVTVDPPHVGYTAVHLYLLDASGRPAARPDDLTATLSLPTAQIGPLDLRLVEAGTGHYQVDGADLVVPGRWQLTVNARRGDFDLDTATVEVPVAG